MAKSEAESVVLNRRSSAYLPHRIDRQSTVKHLDKLKSAEKAKTSSVDDKLATLKAYRRAKGLCFVCGERWGRDHKCNSQYNFILSKRCLNFVQWR